MGTSPGAKVRLSKRTLSDIQYSPDGSRLAAATRIGIWIYDVYTSTELT